MSNTSRFVTPAALQRSSRPSDTNYQDTGRSIQGCSYSTNDVLVTRWGVPSLETLLTDGRGLPSGSLMLVEEDEPRSTVNHTTSLLKCFIAEGILSGHYILAYDPLEQRDKNSSRWLSSLPAPFTKSADEGDKEKGSDSHSKMSIAWRYRHLKTSFDSNSEQMTAGQMRVFDLDKKLTGLTDSQREQLLVVDDAKVFLQHASQMAIQAQSERTMLRLVVRSGMAPGHTDSMSSRWVYQLKRIMNAHPQAMIALISIPPPAVHSPSHLHSLYLMADLVFALRTNLNSNIPDYSAFLQLVKPLKWPGSLISLLPPTSDIALKSRRRQLIFEPFHLPPNLEQGDEKADPASNYDKSSKSLDF